MMEVRRIVVPGWIVVIVDYGLGARPESFAFREGEYEEVAAFEAWIAATVALITNGRVRLERVPRPLPERKEG